MRDKISFLFDELIEVVTIKIERTENKSNDAGHPDDDGCRKCLSEKQD